MYECFTSCMECTITYIVRPMPFIESIRFQSDSLPSLPNSIEEYLNGLFLDKLISGILTQYC